MSVDNDDLGPDTPGTSQFGMRQKWHVCRTVTVPTGWPGQKAISTVCTKATFRMLTAVRVRDALGSKESEKTAVWGILPEVGFWGRLFNFDSFHDNASVFIEANKPGHANK